MACTTILVGKGASVDGSTLIARNDDGGSDFKKYVVREAKINDKDYKSKISEVIVKLPKNAYRYTAIPNVDLSKGLWEAQGVNEFNVGMSATETITSNPRVLGADPIKYEIKNGKQKPVGIGEEDLVTLVLPYIKSAKEGVLRLAKLLEEYGTYESNGIAFSDKDEIWYLETIGAHHFIAIKVPDDKVVILPNQLGINYFDFNDKNNYLCSADLKDFIINNHLYDGDLNIINPRIIFGSHTDQDHVYNSPRAWYMLRCINYDIFKKYENEIESDELPFMFNPKNKISVEDIKYILGSHYQGTEYDPYISHSDKVLSGKYRSIGINRTDDCACIQIRGYMPKEYQAIEWIGMGSNTFNTFIAQYTNVSRSPKYLSNTTLHIDVNNFYWAIRMIQCLADKIYGKAIVFIERYQLKTMTKAHEILNDYDNLLKNNFDEKLLLDANEELAKMVEIETKALLEKLLDISYLDMKNSYQRHDN